MRNVRIIARLDIKGPNLVKGIHLEGLRVLGKPEEFARFYYESGADEIIYQDVVASLYGRNSLEEIIARTAKEIFIPLTVGGGLRTIEDIARVLRAGADKVSINTAAIKDPEIIRKVSREFGSSTVVIAIEAIRQEDGRYFAYTDNGRDWTNVEVLWWARKVEELGAGEIIITSVDREGTGQGFDIGLVSMVSEAVNIPVIAHGGAGKIEHIYNVIEDGHADAVCLSSILHYDYIGNSEHLSICEDEGNIEFLKSKRTCSLVNSASLQDIKRYIHLKGVGCRINNKESVNSGERT